jgi:hypothetical protein
MLALLLFALQADGPGTEADLHRRVAAQPAAVRQFIVRRAMCNHWGGEEPYDPKRRRQIREAVRDLGCTTLAGEEAFLRGYFRGRADTAQLLEDSRDESGWVDDP